MTEDGIIRELIQFALDPDMLKDPAELEALESRYKLTEDIVIKELIQFALDQDIYDYLEDPEELEALDALRKRLGV